MAKKIILILLIGCLPLVKVSAQELDSLHRSHYSFNIGAGWTHYFNTLELGKDNVRPDKIGVSFRFFWEPGYRLSLGLESGYYTIYRFKASGEAGNADIDMKAVPLLLVARMRVIDRVHVSAGTGVTIMSNTILAQENKISNSFLSLSTYKFSASYLYPLGKHFRISGETGVFYFGKTDDWMYMLEGVISFVI